MKTIRIAHLSDAHLPGPMPRGRAWLSKRGLSALSWRIKRHKRHRTEVIETLTADLLTARPDIVAVTGDQVNFGMEAEFKAARAWLTRLGPPGRVVAIAGNHDALGHGWEDALNRHWAGYASLEPRLCRADPVALIAVSTAVVTPPLLAKGWIASGHLETLQGLIREAAAEGLCPVVLMHHPPTPIASWRKGLEGHRSVAAALATAGAALVLHGHNHRRDLSWIHGPEGNIPVLGIPSFSMVPGPSQAAACWRMLEIATTAEGGWTLDLRERAIQPDGAVRDATPLRLRLGRSRACRGSHDR